MASNQLRFEYAITKFTKSSFTSSLKPMMYTNAMQWCSFEKLNKHLWRTFNLKLNYNLPIGNCWTCGIVHNVYSCDYCNVNHICKSCKDHRIDLCPFVSSRLNRFQHDLVRIENAFEITDELLIEHLLPLYEKYYQALQSISRNAIWKELQEKKKKGTRMHSLSNTAVDLDDCYLPTNIISFRSIDHQIVHNRDVITLNLLFGHYEPTRNRESNVSYTNINLRHYKKMYDIVTYMNLQLSLTRKNSFKPMISFDVTPNKEQVPFINDQEYVNQLNAEAPNFALLHTDGLGRDDFVLCRPILTLFQPDQLIIELITAWLVINPNVTLTELQKKHYSTILTLGSSIKWPARSEAYVGFAYFSYHENLVAKLLSSIRHIRTFALASHHFIEHTGFFENGCVYCDHYNEFLDYFRNEAEKELMKTCCYHDKSNCNLESIFTVSHRLNHDELLWRTMYDLRAMMVHFARIADDLLNQSEFKQSYLNMPVWSDSFRYHHQYLTANCHLSKLDNLQKCWSVNDVTRNRICKQLSIPVNSYAMFEVLDIDEEVQLTIDSEDGFEIIERPATYKWLKRILFSA